MLFCRKSFAKPVCYFGSNFLSVPKLRLFSVGNSRLIHSTLLLTYVLLSKLRNVTMPQFPNPFMGSYSSVRAHRLYGSVHQYSPSAFSSSDVPSIAVLFPGSPAVWDAASIWFSLCVGNGPLQTHECVPYLRSMYE